MDQSENIFTSSAADFKREELNTEFFHRLNYESWVLKKTVKLVMPQFFKVIEKGMAEKKVY